MLRSDTWVEESSARHDYQIVTETLEPGSSVSIVARRQDVNTNQVFKCRRELSPRLVATSAPVQMLPVEIVAERQEPVRRARRSGVIEIAFACGARVCLCGVVLPETLRQVIELLR